MTFYSNDDRGTSPSDNADDHAPASRDKHGRFAGGRHNPKGRPKKEKPPTSLTEAVARVLAEPVTVTIKGKRTKIPGYQAFARKLVTQLYNGSPLDVIRMHRMIERLNAFDELKNQEATKSEEASGNVWTAELEERFQAINSDYVTEDGTCCLCGGHSGGGGESNDSDRGVELDTIGDV